MYDISDPVKECYKLLLLLPGNGINSEVYALLLCHIQYVHDEIKMA